MEYGSYRGTSKVVLFHLNPSLYTLTAGNTLTYVTDDQYTTQYTATLQGIDKPTSTVQFVVMMNTHGYKRKRTTLLIPLSQLYSKVKPTCTVHCAANLSMCIYSKGVRCTVQLTVHCTVYTCYNVYRQERLF